MSSFASPPPPPPPRSPRPLPSKRTKAPEALIARAIFLVFVCGCCARMVADVFGLKYEMLKKRVQRVRAKRKDERAARAAALADEDGGNQEGTAAAALRDAHLRASTEQVSRRAKPCEHRSHFLESSSSSDAMTKRLYRDIGNADYCVDVSVFILSDPHATTALLNAKQHAAHPNFRARVLLDASQTAPRGSTSLEAIVALYEAGVKLYLLSGRVAGSYMHTKFSVIDRRLVYHGSMNYSVKGRCNNIEVVTEDECQECANDFTEHFEAWIANPATVEINNTHILEFKYRIAASAAAAAARKRARHESACSGSTSVDVQAVELLATLARGQYE